MKKLKVNRLLKIVLTVIAAVIFAGAVSLSASAPLVVSMADSASADKGFNLFESGYNNEYVGVYTFNSAQKALEVSYSTMHSEYRFLIRMDKKDTLGDDLSWMVVTYKTDTKVAAAMKFNNSNGNALVLSDDISVSKGQWVRTEAVNIKNPSLGIVDHFARLCGSLWNFIEIESTDTVSKLYIKEIAFFKSKAEADNYYKDSVVTTAPNASESAKQGAVNYDVLDGRLGEFKVVSLLKGDGLGDWSYDEATGVKLNYASDGSYGGNYRTMFRFTRMKEYPEHYNYVRVVYSAQNSASETDKVSLVLVDPQTGERAVLTDNVVNTNGNYVLSDTAFISDSVVERLAGTGSYATVNSYETGDRYHTQKHCSLAFSSDTDGGEYYIRNIYFFNSKAGADAFVPPEFKVTPEDNNVDIGKYPDFTVSDPVGVIELKYDDRYTFSKSVAYIDSIKIDSTSAVTGEKDKTVLKRVEGETFAASATGEAKVIFKDGTSTTVKVSAAPINLLIMCGQSNAEGYVGSSATSVRNERGQVYSTYAPSAPMVSDKTVAKGFETDGASIYNADVFVTQSLTTTKSRVNAEISYPLDALCEGGIGKAGMDAAIAYKWNSVTGEKVWIVNASHSGTGIRAWQPGNEVTENEYWQAVNIVKSVQETLKSEIAAGHYTLSNMGYYWLQGCTDKHTKQATYTDGYIAMHEGFMRDMAFDHDSNSATPEKTLDFGGIILVRTSYEDNTPKDFEMNGPRLSQYYIGNTGTGSLANVYLVSNLGDVFKSDDTVKHYFIEKYGTEENFKKESGNVSYKMPTTLKEVHPDIHYRQPGYTELGFDAAENTLRILGYIDNVKTPTLTFLGADGNPVDVSAGLTMKAGEKIMLVPTVTPTAASGVDFKIANGNITVSGLYEFTSNGKSDTVTFTAGETSITVYINTFVDVKESDCFYDAVNFAVSRGLFSGTSPSTFDPYSNMTRAMFVTVLGRLDGIDSAKYNGVSFDDVAAGSWYAPYVEWAASNGIVNGVSANEYGINAPITVEQACTILARYSKFANSKAGSALTIDSFTDGASVSDWAKNNVEWALKNGIYTGHSGRLNPTDPATRALVATMFANYVTVFGE